MSRIKKRPAFVLGGGGVRGVMQHISLRSLSTVQTLDISVHRGFFKIGYEIMQQNYRWSADADRIEVFESYE